MFHVQISPEGRYLVIEGLDGPLESGKRICKLFDLPSRLLESIPTEVPARVDGGWFRFDPTGTMLIHVDKRTLRRTYWRFPA